LERHASGRKSSKSNERYALYAFVAVVVLAFPMYLVRGRFWWFYYDEWDFLANRDAGNIRDLLRPHAEHWQTLPILAFRLLWHIVGLRSYTVYQVGVVACHLSVAVLLWVVMRRSAVQPWLATAAGSLFVLFGSGHVNIIYAFQIGYTGSLACGLAFLVLADHDGPLDRRDAAGFIFGLAALMSSGLAVTMIAVVALATLLRRGWRVAAVLTAPLAALFLLWWLGVGRSGYRGRDLADSPSDAVRFVTDGLRNAFSDMGQLPGIGLALAAVLVVGLVLVWRDAPRTELRRRYAAPVALLAGALIFLITLGVGRTKVGPVFSETVDPTTFSRFVHVVVALMLPAVAVGADALVRRWRVLFPAVLALFLVGIPGNIRALEPENFDAWADAQRTFMLAVPRSEVAQEVPPSLRPNPLARGVTVGWLLDGVESGRIPDPGHVSPETSAFVTLSLALQASARQPSTTDCVPLTRPITRHLPKGTNIGIEGGAVRVELVEPDGSVISPGITYNPRSGALSAAAAVTVQVSAATPDRPAALCL
jgi:hypothetical protein